MPRKYILASNLETIEARFGCRAPLHLEWAPAIVVSPGDASLIVTWQKQSELTLSSFGMTPVWAKSSMQLINARAEGDKNPDNNPAFSGSKAIFMKPAFQKPLFSQRCIVIADAFIEWSSGILPKPYLCFLREHRHPIGFAGLYDVWINPVNREQLHSFTIITVAANTLISGLPSSRMPVILPFGQELRWLKPNLSRAEVLNMLQLYPSAKMNAFPVSGNIEQSGPFTKEILMPAGPKLVSEENAPTLSVKSYYGHKKKP